MFENNNTNDLKSNVSDTVSNASETSNNEAIAQVKEVVNQDEKTTQKVSEPTKKLTKSQLLRLKIQELEKQEKAAIKAEEDAAKALKVKEEEKAFRAFDKQLEPLDNLVSSEKFRKALKADGLEADAVVAAVVKAFLKEGNQQVNSVINLRFRSSKNEQVKALLEKSKNTGA
jgi:hypothetical protein